MWRLLITSFALLACAGSLTVDARGQALVSPTPLPRRRGVAPRAVPTLTISSVRMTNGHTLRVRVALAGGAAGSVRASVTLPGAAVLIRSVAFAEGSSTAQVDLDFRAAGVPRFSRTVHTQVEAELLQGEQPVSTDLRACIIPLPVVTVHGIQILGGSGDFPALEQSLVQASAAADGADSAYARFADEGGEGDPGYPTLYAFRWNSNSKTLAQGSQELRAYLRGTVSSHTWSNRVMLIGHSRGANLVRDFLCRYALADGSHPDCAGALLACTPASGAVDAAQLPAGGWRDLLPTWPWSRERRGSGFHAVPPNRTLTVLNTRHPPAGIPVIAFYGVTTGSRDTHNSYTQLDTRSPFTSVSGDGYVTEFSARGQIVTPSAAHPDHLTRTRTVRWFQGVPTQRFAFDRTFGGAGGLHTAFLDQPEVQQAVFGWLQEQANQAVAFRSSSLKLGR